VNHREFEPGSTCPGYLKPRYQTSGRRPLDVWECDGCGLTNCPAVARRLQAVWRRLKQRGRIQQTEPVTEVGQMRIKLSVNRKAGAPGYGSDGAAAEVELDLDDDLVKTPEGFVQAMLHYYSLIERGVAEQVVKMHASHPQPEPPSPSGARAFQDDRRSVEPPPRRFAEDIPPPSRRRPEPGYDEEPRDQEPPPRGQNGYGGRQQQRAVAQIDPPRNGSQLAAIVKKFPEWKEPVDAWGAAQKLQWKYTTWPDDAAQACWHDVTTRTTAGQWGGN